jgi:hypothetical protein
MTVHTYGDSHSNLPWVFIKVPEYEIIIHWKTGCTMARFSLEKKQLCNLKNDIVKENDTVIFCFGEVDCRVHYGKTENYKDLLKDIVKEYFRVIKSNVDDYYRLNVLIYPVPPVLEQYSQQTILSGTLQQRKEIVEFMNEQLQSACDTYEYRLFDIYSQCLNERGFMNMLLSDHTGHITDNDLIVSNLKRYIA